MAGRKKAILWLCVAALLAGWGAAPWAAVQAADVPLAGVFQQAPGDPDGDPAEDPDGETSGDPDGDPAEDPDGETSGDPDGDPAEDPDGETSGDPDGDPAEDPDGETSGDPDGDPAEDPDGETSGNPDGDPAEDPDGETPGDPDGTTPGGPNMGTPPEIGGEGQESPSEGGDTVQTYIESLGTRTMTEGDELYYQTVAPQFANIVSPPDYYPGALTVRVDGQVTVGAGAVLAIGTMAVGSTQELSPLIQDAGGQIVVQAGGELSLTDVEFDWTDGEPLIIQEPGAVVTLWACGDIPQGVIQWADPVVVDNSAQKPGDIWLMEGTPLTAGDLPQQLNTYLVTQGRSEWTTLSLAWDFSPYQGQTQGSITLTGQFLDENGAVLKSRDPLTVTVHWYPVGTLVVTQADWIGDTVPVARLAISEIPEEADRVWGEVSEDGGVTWIAWEDCNQLEIFGNSTGGLLVFSMPDTTPRLFRAAAESWNGHQYWVSEAFLLPTEDSDDQGGNRGGSTLPSTPDRTPAPVPEEPTPTPDQGDTSQCIPGAIQPRPTQQAIHWVVPRPSDPSSQQNTPPAASPQPTPPPVSTAAPPNPEGSPSPDTGTAVSPAPAGTVDPPAPSQDLETGTAVPSAPAASQIPETGSSDAPAPSVSPSGAVYPSGSPSPAVSPASQGDRGLPLPLQAGLVAAGLALCMLVGAAAAGMGPFRRKR